MGEKKLLSFYSRKEKNKKPRTHTHKSVTSNLFLPFYWGRKTHHNTKQQKKGSKAHPHPHVLCGRFIPANSQRFRLAGKGVSAYCVHAGCRYLQPSKRKCGEINHITGPASSAGDGNRGSGRAQMFGKHFTNFKPNVGRPGFDTRVSTGTTGGRGGVDCGTKGHSDEIGWERILTLAHLPPLAAQTDIVTVHRPWHRYVGSKPQKGHPCCCCCW